MAIPAIAWAFEQPCESPSQRFVLVALAYNAAGPDSEEPGVCWPSIALIAKRVGMSERQVKRHVTALCEAGLVVKKSRRRRPDGSLSVWEYIIPYSTESTARPQETPGGHQGTPTSPGEQPRGHPGSALGDTDDMHQGTPMSPQEPSEEPSEEPSLTLISTQPQVSSSSPTFAEWWDRYPRKVAKKDANRAWDRLTPNQRQQALDVIDNHVILWRTEGRGTRTVPHPATWLNGHRFADELAYIPERNTASNRTDTVLNRLANGELA